MKWNTIVHRIFWILLVWCFIEALRSTLRENEPRAILFLAWLLVITQMQSFFYRWEQAIIRAHRYPRKEGEEQ